ncbi:MULTISPECIES: hypothetical protein [Gammaproteobacteria]
MSREDWKALAKFAEQVAFGMLLGLPVVGAACLLVYALGLRAHWWL